MNHSSRTSSDDRSSRVAATIYALVSLLAGWAALWAAWIFYTHVADAATFTWLRLMQPALLAVAAILFMCAAPLLLLRRPQGWSVFVLAASMVPLFFILRLLLVVVRFITYAVGAVVANADRIIDGSIFVGWRPSWLVIANIVVVVLLVGASIVNKLNKQARERDDRR